MKHMFVMMFIEVIAQLLCEVLNSGWVWIVALFMG